MSKQKSFQAQNSMASQVSYKELGMQEQEQPVNDVAFSTCVRVLRQNWRQGTLGCKTRSEVTRSNKKPWKQKGTGRARAGTARSPLWRGGGIIFGPQARTRVLEVTKKVKKRAFADLLNEFLRAGRVVCLDWAPQGEVPKTSAAFNTLKAAQLGTEKVNVFVPIDDFITQASFANIPTVRLLFFDQANVFDLANCDYWIFLKKDFDAFKEMVSRWI